MNTVLEYVISAVITIIGGIIIYLFRHYFASKKEITMRLEKSEKKIIELDSALKYIKEVLDSLDERLNKIEEKLWSKFIKK